MPNSEKIELLISPEALKQFEQLKSSTDANTASFEKLIAKAVELNKALGSASTFKEINVATAKMTENEKALAKQKSELQKQQEKLNDLFTIEAQKLAQLKAAQADQNKALKEQAQEALGLTDAYKKLELEYNKAAKEAKNLAVQFGANSKEAKEASARALELDARLKAADANTGKFNRNVGNYSGALKVMEKGLQDVKKKIDDYTNSGNQNAAMLASLQNEERLLEQLLQAQVSGFASGTQEVRANTKALESLAAAGLQGTEAYQKLFAATASLKDEVGDLKKALANAAPDDVAFNAATDAAKGLVGVYGFAKSAAAVFGDENEALNETMVKLQAAETALQSIEAIRAVFKKENAVRQAIEIVQGKVIVAQKYLETAAESKNIIVKYAAIAAQKALNFATSAAGGPILILIGLLATAFVSMAAYGGAAEDAAKKNERLTKSLERTNKAIEESDKTIKSKGDKTLAQLEDQFASEEDIRFQKEQNTIEEIENLKKFNAIDAKNREDAIKNVQRLTSGKVKQDKEAIAEAIKVRDGYLANLQKVTDKENELEILRLQNSRALKEEMIEASQNEIEAQKTQLQTSLQLQQNIAGNELKTQKERINALKEAERLQEQIINKEANSKRLDPTLTPSEIKVIEAGRAAALIQARRESNKAIEDINRSYAERERKARFDIIRTEIEDQIKAADLIVANEKSTFDQRTDALYEGLQKRRAIIIAQHDFDIQNDTLTAEERIAIEKKYISDINALTVEYGLQQAAIYQQNTDKVNEIIAKGQQARQDKIAGDAASTITGLIKSLVGGQTSLEDFNRQREKAERDARIQSLKEEVNNATAKVLVTKEGTAARFEAERELHEKTLALNEEYHAKELDAIVKLNDLKKQLAVESVQTFNALINGQFDNEAARIQQAMDDLEKRKEKEIEEAKATIANKAEREAAIIRIEKNAQVEREQLERRQKQIALDRARFEKASNIAQIISTTAIAVIKAFKDYPGPAAFPIAAAIGAIGALQLARAIAAPLPQFADGTTDAPGGLSWVGDGGKKELVITPQGKVMQTPAVPTVMNVPKHSIVLPDARAALESGLAVNRHGRLVQQENADIKDVGRKIDTLTKVMRNKPVLNMSADQSGLTAMWNYGANRVKYIEEQTGF